METAGLQPQPIASKNREPRPHRVDGHTDGGSISQTESKQLAKQGTGRGRAAQHDGIDRSSQQRLEVIGSGMEVITAEIISLDQGTKAGQACSTTTEPGFKASMLAR